MQRRDSISSEQLRKELEHTMLEKLSQSLEKSDQKCSKLQQENEELQRKLAETLEEKQKLENEVANLHGRLHKERVHSKIRSLRLPSYDSELLRDKVKESLTSYDDNSIHASTSKTPYETEFVEVNWRLLASFLALSVGFAYYTTTKK